MVNCSLHQDDVEDILELARMTVCKVLDASWFKPVLAARLKALTAEQRPALRLIV